MDITPDKQNIDRVFSNTTYYIDFYQRDYKWSSAPVVRLIDDVFFKFDQQYEQNRSLSPSKEAVAAKYHWYYLNTYVTNTIDGKVYIVDGQQRLTTLTLILINMRHMSTRFDSKLGGWLGQKIAGQSGFDSTFWMTHERHKHVLQDLNEGTKQLTDIDVSTGVTAVNMVQNYATISTEMDARITDQHKFETFVFFFLYRLVLINLAVEQTDVPMVFEVINDRGVKLKPFEILKGKLLGQIDKLELDKRDYNGLWERQVRRINDLKDDDIDSFFRYLLKAKYSETRKEGTRFDGDYHREMFATDMDSKLSLRRNAAKVKEFLEGEFKYYTERYATALEAYEEECPGLEHVYLNSLNELDSQFMLMLSSLKLKDQEDDQKLDRVAAELDRFFVLLQLQQAYDSNAFAEALFRISREIREKPIEALRPAFDKVLMEELSSRRNMDVTAPFHYNFFRTTGINLNPRFKRYFFARVDRFLARGMNMNEKHPIKDLVSKTGAKTGFHVEHILSNNDENLALFDGKEDLFEQERNRLGGILLLKGQDNISSGNEPYKRKLRTYANTLYWNETLREDSYKSKLDMRALKAKHILDLEHLDEFGPAQLDTRHELLFKIASIIWA